MSDTDITVGDVRYSPDYESKASRKSRPVQVRIEGDPNKLAAAFLQPGEPCPACERRVPFPKTEKTPPTKKKAYWVPVDEHEAHEDVLETAAKHLGCFGQPYFEFKTVALALALVLQDENLRGFAHRRPEYRDYEVPQDAEPETQGLA